VSMANAIKYFKAQIGHTLGLEVGEARAMLLQTADAYINERVTLVSVRIAHARTCV
jgi:hypothetical protein